MQPTLLYYVNLSLCGLVFLELLITLRKNTVLKLYFLLIIASLITMNYFAITGISTKVEFMFARFMRLVYVCSTLLALIHLVNRKVPKWFFGLVVVGAVTITSLRIAYYNEINIQALPNVPNHVFSVGADFYSPKPIARAIGLALGVAAIVIAYYYYRRLLMKLDIDSAYYKPLSMWIISLVVPFFLLTIFGILGYLKMFSETVSSYLFAFFSCATICSFVLRPRFLDNGLLRESNAGNSQKQSSAVVV